MSKYRVSPTKAKPSLYKALLSLTMPRNTGSIQVVQTLYKLVCEISYMKAFYTKDKQVHQAKLELRVIPLNIKKNLSATHVADNID